MVLTIRFVAIEDVHSGKAAGTEPGIFEILVEDQRNKR